MADRSLRIKLLADTSSYRSEMERASRLGNNYYKSANNSSQRLTQYLNQNTAAFAGLNRNIQTATATLKTFAGAFLGGFAISSVINVADSYGQMAQRIRNSLQAVEGDFSSYETVQKRLLDTSIRNAKDLADSQELYIRSAESMRDLGYNTSQTLDFVESLSSAFTSNATSSDKVKSSIDALNKAFVTGKVSAQQWQTLSAAMPNLAGEIAKALNRERKDIVKLGTEGKLSIIELANGAIKAKDSFNALADSMDNTVKDGFVQLSNAFQGWIGEANQSHKVTATLVQGMTYLAKNFDIVVNSGTALVALSLARYFGGLSTSILSAASASIKATAEARNHALAQKQLLTVNLQNLAIKEKEYLQQQKNIAIAQAHTNSLKAQLSLNSQMAVVEKNLVAIRAEQAIATNSLTAATKRASLASTALSNAQNLLKSGLNLIGGPVGAAMLAGGALLYFMNRAKEAKQESLELGAKVDKLKESFDSLTDSQLELKKLELLEDEKKLAEQIEFNAYQVKKTAQEYDNLKSRYNSWYSSWTTSEDAINSKRKDQLQGIEEQNKLLENQKKIKNAIADIDSRLKNGNPSPQEPDNLPSEIKGDSGTNTGLENYIKNLNEKIAVTRLELQGATQDVKNFQALKAAGISDDKSAEAQQVIALTAEYEKLNLAKNGQSLAEKEIFNQQSPLEKINIEEQQKLDLLNQWKETGLANEATYQEALIAIERSASAQRQKILDDEAAAKIANTQTLLSATSSLFGGLADITKTFSGEQSNSYKALFAVEKGFAIANAALSLQTAIANAWKLSYPANIPAIGQAIAAGSQVASAISSISYGGGREHGGTVLGKTLYQVGEGNKPELFSSGGKQYMIPGDNGRVFSNKDVSMSSSDSPSWTFIVENNASGTEVMQPSIDHERRIVKWAVTEVASGIRNKNGDVWNALSTTTNVKARL